MQQRACIDLNVAGSLWKAAWSGGRLESEGMASQSKSSLGSTFGAAQHGRGFVQYRYRPMHALTQACQKPAAHQIFRFETLYTVVCRWCAGCCSANGDGGRMGSDVTAHDIYTMKTFEK